MKKLFALPVLILSCILLASCNNSDSYIPPPPDRTLAGSISFNNYIIEAEGSYDGVILDDSQYFRGILSISKLSDTEVSLHCTTEWGTTKLVIAIPYILVLGKPYDAELNFTSPDATITYDGTKYTSINTTVKGWIKSSNLYATRSSPIIFSYISDINIGCILNGKELNLRIISAKP